MKHKFCLSDLLTMSNRTTLQSQNCRGTNFWDTLYREQVVTIFVSSSPNCVEGTSKENHFPLKECLGAYLSFSLFFSTSLFSFQYQVSHRQTSGHTIPVQPAYGSRGCLYLKSFSMEFLSDIVSFLRQNKAWFMKT